MNGTYYPNMTAQPKIRAYLKIVLSPMVASNVGMGRMIFECFTHMCLGIRRGTQKKVNDLC